MIYTTVTSTMQIGGSVEIFTETMAATFNVTTETCQQTCLLVITPLTV